MTESTPDLSRVTRVTVVGPTGRVFEDYQIYAETDGAELSIQDEGQTLKILPAKPITRRPRILVTGNRHFTNTDTVRSALLQALAQYGNLDAPHLSTLVHGGAPGADTTAQSVARELGMTIEVHPAQWSALGKKAGPIRNQEMVNAGADVCLAFPVGDSRGTRGCMAMAERAGIPVINVTE